MKQIPEINNLMQSMLQYFHIYWSNTTAVMKKTKCNKQLKPNCINLFLRLKLQNKLCHIIDLLHRELTRIPKSQHLLFYDFFIIYDDFPNFSHKKENRFAHRPLSYPQNKLQPRGPCRYYSHVSWLHIWTPHFCRIWARGPWSRTEQGRLAGASCSGRRRAHRRQGSWWGASRGPCALAGRLALLHCGPKRAGHMYWRPGGEHAGSGGLLVVLRLGWGALAGESEEVDVVVLWLWLCRHGRARTAAVGACRRPWRRREQQGEHRAKEERARVESESREE